MPRKDIPPEQLDKVRHLYEQTLAPVPDIAGMLGMTGATFHKRVKEQGWRSRRAMKGHFHFARALVDGTAGQQVLPPEPVPLSPERRAELRSILALRLHSVIERELEAIERVTAVLRPADQAQAASCADTLASLARATRELAALNKPDDVPKPNDDDNRQPDVFPVDIEQLRDELACRLRALAEQHRAARIGGPVS